MIAREEAPPPIATTLFRLTSRGEQLSPVLDGLFRWGIRLMTEEKPRDAVRSHWLAGALERMLVDREADSPAVTLELQTGDHPIAIEARDGVIQTRLGPAESPDLTLTGSPHPTMGLLLGVLDLAHAEAKGVDHWGNPAVLERIRGEMDPCPADVVGRHPKRLGGTSGPANRGYTRARWRDCPNAGLCRAG